MEQTGFYILLHRTKCCIRTFVKIKIYFSIWLLSMLAITIKAPPAFSSDEICVRQAVVYDSAQEFTGPVQRIRIWFTPINSPFKYTMLSITTDAGSAVVSPYIRVPEGYWRPMLESETIPVGGWAFIETDEWSLGRQVHCDQIRISIEDDESGGSIASDINVHVKEYSRQGHSCGEGDQPCPGGPMDGDRDGDGIVNMYDMCPDQNSNSSVFTAGCPDIDNDLWPDIDESPECVGSKDSQIGDKIRGSDRGPKPLPGCSFKFSLRWMGMEILNNSAMYRHGMGGRIGLEANEEDSHDGEEPYLFFSWINGMGDLGELNYGTARWCCGDGVDTEVENERFEPDDDTRLEEYPNALNKLKKYGLPVWPSFPGEYAPIDSDKGLLVSASLMERDWKAMIYPTEEQPSLEDAFSKGGQIAGAFASIVGSGGSLAGLKVIGELVISFFDGLFSSKPDPVEVDDPDDYSGTDIWATTKQGAISKTAKNGAYAFLIDVPTSYDIICENYFGYCPVGVGYPLKIRARLHMCLVREGIDENSIPELCSNPQMVMPWPMDDPQMPNGFSAVMANQFTLDQGQSRMLHFNNKRKLDLVTRMEFGSEFDLKIYNPEGGLYKKKRSAVSPIEVDIPDATEGKWLFEVTAIHTPHPQDPIVLKVGAPDQDGDLILDIDDNCPDRYNTNQLDTDGNGIGDVCDSSIPANEETAIAPGPENKRKGGGGCFISSLPNLSDY